MAATKLIPKPTGRPCWDGCSSTLGHAGGCPNNPDAPTCDDAITGWQCIREPGHEPPCWSTPSDPLPCDICEPVVTDEALQARCEALADSLRALVSILRRTGGYMSAADQRQYREAEARLVEIEA